MKNIIIASLIGITGIGFLLKNKATQFFENYEAAIKQLKFMPIDVANLSLSGGKLQAGIKLNITNPTTTNLVAETGGLAKLTKLYFYTNNGVFIGEALPNISAFNFPANTTTLSERIPIIIPIKFSLIPTILSIMQDPKNITVKAEVNVLNKTYTI